MTSPMSRAAWVMLKYGRLSPQPASIASMQFEMPPIDSVLRQCTHSESPVPR
jgi:hypothetical protein